MIRAIVEYFIGKKLNECHHNYSPQMGNTTTLICWDCGHIKRDHVHDYKPMIDVPYEKCLCGHYRPLKPGLPDMKGGS
jgi:hypothetical protein